MLTALSLVLAAVAAPAPLAHVGVALPSRDTAVLTLTASWNDPAPRGFESQRLLAGDVSIPLAAAPAVTVAGGELRTEVTVRLKDVPEAVLNLDPNSLPLRWEGLDRKGRVVAALAGTVDLGDREKVALPIRTLYDQFLLVRDVSASPGLSAVGVRALLGFYNPFAFDVVATRVEYRLDAKDGAYVKRADAQGKPLAEDNWVWSPMGLVNIHYPEMWGTVQFSGLVAGRGRESVRSLPEDEVRWALRRIYYRQWALQAEKGAFAAVWKDLGLKDKDFKLKGFAFPPAVLAAGGLFEASYTAADGAVWRIAQDGRTAAGR